MFDPWCMCLVNLVTLNRWVFPFRFQIGSNLVVLSLFWSINIFYNYCPWYFSCVLACTCLVLLCPGQSLCHAEHIAISFHLPKSIWVWKGSCWTHNKRDAKSPTICKALLGMISVKVEAIKKLSRYCHCDAFEENFKV